MARSWVRKLDSFVTMLQGQNVNYADMTFTTTVSPVPEPSTLALLGSGLLGLAMMRRRKLSRSVLRLLLSACKSSSINSIGRGRAAPSPSVVNALAKAGVDLGENGGAIPRPKGRPR